MNMPKRKNPVKLVGETYEERTEASEHGLALTERERLHFSNARLQARTLEILGGSELNVCDAEKELQVNNGTLCALYFQPDAVLEFKEEIAKRLVAEYLNIEHEFSHKETLRKFNMTPWQLRLMCKDPVFRDQYNASISDLQMDPSIGAVQKGVVEVLLPRAYRSFMWELSEDAPPGVRQKARQDVFKLAGVKELESRQNDRQEATRFLTQLNLQDPTINISLPQAYADALALNRPIEKKEEIVEGEVKEGDDPPSD